MGKRLNQFNKQIEKRIEGWQEKTKKEEDPLKEYEDLMQGKKVFPIAFDGCDTDGTFSTIKDDIMVILDRESLAESPAFRQSWVRRMVGFEFDVTVKSVDREEKKVYVRPVHKATPIKEQLIREIIQELNAGNNPVVWGRITSVKEEVATVDILGQHILGLVNCVNWSNSYIRNLKEQCFPGEFYQFVIHNAKKKESGKQQAFYLDRKPLAGDPWKQLNLEHIHPGGMLLVKCIDRPQGKTYWWGTCGLAPEIEIMGDYEDKRIDIVRGLSYKCRIKTLKVDGEPKERMFKVVPIDISDQDRDRYRKLRAEKQRIQRKELEVGEMGVDLTELP